MIISYPRTYATITLDDTPVPVIILVKWPAVDSNGDRTAMAAPMVHLATIDVRMRFDAIEDGHLIYWFEVGFRHAVSMVRARVDAAIA
jgi:hypothetical protein